MSTPRLYAIERDGPGRLWTMAAPDGGDRLAAECRALRSNGVDVLVSMLDRREAERLGLTSERACCERAGMEFRQLPTDDFGVPVGADALSLGRGVRAELLAGRGVAIHCRAGIGRSSLLAAVVLRLEGVRPAEAWARIGRARGVRVPETQAQRDFLDELDSSG